MSTVDAPPSPPAQSAVSELTADNLDSVGGLAPNPDAVLPSDCGCGGGKGPEFVYAIGSLTYDFGTATRRDSLQQSAEPIVFLDGQKPSGAPPLPLNLSLPKDFLRHVLGFREFQVVTSGGRGNQPAAKETKVHQPHQNDLKAVHWLLVRDKVNPVYALAPRGPFAELMYEQLANFLLSQNGLRHEDLDVYYVLDSSTNPPKVTIIEKPQSPKSESESESPVKPTPYCAMPGMLLSGEVRLLSGQAISAINPDQRGTLQWSIDQVRLVLPSDNAGEAAAAILDRLLEEARNSGRAGPDRARTFFASRVLHGESVASGLKAYVRNWKEVHIGQIVVNRSKNVRQGSENYDVEIELFNPDAVQTALLVLSQTVDVADVVPALVDNVRTFRRRHQD